MRQLRSNIFISLSLFVLQGCGSGGDENTPIPGGSTGGAPGDTSPSLACGASQLHAARHDGCAAMDVQGQDACNCTSMGWTWNGSACVALDAGFCKCVGKDCDKLATSKEDCEASHAACAPVTKKVACGEMARFESVHATCTAMDVQGHGACYCASMGWTWNGSACVALDAGFCECVGDDCDKLAKSKEECEADHAACLPEFPSILCGSSALLAKTHDVCGKMDVRGEGACYCASMGWTWDGAACVELAAGFCKCVGEDCDKLSPTKQDCLSQHAPCL